MIWYVLLHKFFANKQVLIYLCALDINKNYFKSVNHNLHNYSMIEDIIETVKRNVTKFIQNTSKKVNNYLLNFNLLIFKVILIYAEHLMLIQNNGKEMIKELTTEFLLRNKSCRNKRN